MAPTLPLCPARTISVIPVHGHNEGAVVRRPVSKHKQTSRFTRVRQVDSSWPLIDVANIASVSANGDGTLDRSSTTGFCCEVSSNWAHATQGRISYLFSGNHRIAIVRQECRGRGWNKHHLRASGSSVRWGLGNIPRKAGPEARAQQNQGFTGKKSRGDDWFEKRFTNRRGPTMGEVSVGWRTGDP
jgi:hypothetical protein